MSTQGYTFLAKIGFCKISATNTMVSAYPIWANRSYLLLFSRLSAHFWTFVSVTGKLARVFQVDGIQLAPKFRMNAGMLFRLGRS